MRTAEESELERCRKYRRDCTKQCTVNYLQKASIWMIYYIFKTCVSEKCFLFHQKSSFRSQDIQFFVFSSSIGWCKKNLKIVINCLNKNLITHFVWYLEKEIRCDIETLSIDRKLNKEYFMEKSCRKYGSKVSLGFLSNFSK